MRKRSKKIGLPPGTPVHIGEKKSVEVKVTLIDYDEARFQEKEAETIEDCLAFRDKPTVTWINVDGIHCVDIIEKMGEYFDLHPLVLEDIMNTEQRSKTEDYVNYIFIVLKALHFDEKEKRVKADQVSLILSSKFVITFQEREGDVFDLIKARIRSDKSRMRRMGADYLAYTLMDAIVDNYFAVLEKLEERIEDVEEELVSNPTPETLQAIHYLKRTMMFFRKSVWPSREVISRLERGDSPLIQESTGVYLRDIYDHTIQVIDTIETSRDLLSSMLDIYISTASNKMNEVMKVLTIIATIFIPLTLIASIYGMNFRYMPELEQPWGYPLVYFVMFVVSVVMVVYFRRKKWL